MQTPQHSSRVQKAMPTIYDVTIATKPTNVWENEPTKREQTVREKVIEAPTKTADVVTELIVAEHSAQADYLPLSVRELVVASAPTKVNDAQTPDYRT